LKDGTDALWALTGPGANAVPVSISDTAFAALEMATPPFNKINRAEDLEELKALVPTANTRSHKAFAGKKCIAIPPLLTKILMDANSEDPYVLLKASCKALVDSDCYDAAVVNADGTIGEDATESFFYAVQFLFHVATRPVAGACSIEILTQRRTLDWAPSIHAKCKINVSPPSSDERVSDDAALRVGASIATLQQELRDHKELTRDKQNTAKKKVTKAGVDKLSPFSLRMILNASELIDDDATDGDGNPITTRESPVNSYTTF
jgi:hypothetical protein